MQIAPGSKLTILFADNVMGMTHRVEATAAGCTPGGDGRIRLAMTARGKRKPQVKRVDETTLVLPGWDLGIFADGEACLTFHGNCCLNLVGSPHVGTTDPARLREIIATNLNPVLEKGFVLLWPKQRADGETKPIVVYPAEAAARRHPVLDGHLAELEIAAAG